MIFAKLDWHKTLIAVHLSLEFSPGLRAQYLPVFMPFSTTIISSASGAACGFLSTKPRKAEKGTVN
ncbi:MAG: hypothetical protein K6U74_16625 [Firmicutes bacterium]|nr:hypothetical protein [Bacillota bacterium]